MRKDQWKEEEIAEDFCFTCKDGGHLRVCDFKKCLKAYHPHCVGKDPTFLDDDDRWTCSLHSCSCGKTSTFQCFCCPTSYCRSCIKAAQFVQVKKKTKGFCDSCLRLAKMIEEERHVDSEGVVAKRTYSVEQVGPLDEQEEIDFSNTETYEFLFKDYWEIVKDQEGLTLVDVQAADALLKRGENFQYESDSDKLYEEEPASEPDDIEDDSDEGKPLFKGSRGKRGWKKPLTKKSKKERTFISWASEELMRFLGSIGKDTLVPLTQVDVTEIVKEYVQSNNLFQPNKKRRNIVIPDEKLHSLFRKKKLKYHKIFDLVKGHLAEERSDSKGLSFSSEENEELISAKKQRSMHADTRASKVELNHYRKKISGPPKSCNAAITVENIKLTYLKKSLVMELLKSPKTLEEKIVGCFVRVKNDPKDFYYLVKKAYQLGQVTGIKKAQSTYKIGDTMTDAVLSISNFSGDIKLFMLSDDDIEEEECEDLRQLVKKGLFKPPTIGQLESKIGSVHKDVINHWIDKEIAKLQRQIDRANEKGWRRELDEYIDRRELLLTPKERTRLLEEIPEIAAESEIDIEANVTQPPDLHLVNEEAESEADVAETDAACSTSVVGAISEGDDNMAMLNDTCDHQGNGHLAEADINENVIEDAILGSDMPGKSKTVIPSKNNDSLVMETKKEKEEEHVCNSKPSEIPIIELDDDDDGNEVLNTATADVGDSWHYIDPNGNEQGPFPLTSLKLWKSRGYFSDEFKVWRSGQTENDAILLNTIID